MTTPSTPSPSRTLAGPAVQKRARATRQHSGMGGPSRGLSASPSSNEFEELKAFFEKAVKAQMETVNTKLDGLHHENEEMRDLNLELQGKIENLQVDNAALKNDTVALRSDNAALRSDGAALKEQIQALDTELKTISTNVHETKTELSGIRLSAASSMADPNTAASPPTTYALAASSGEINPSSSVTQLRQKVSFLPAPTTLEGPRQLLGATIDLRRISTEQLEVLKDGATTEARIQEAIKAQLETEHVVIKGIQIKPRMIRVITATDREAADLRLNDKWIHKVFANARARSEDWFPIKVDDVRRDSVLIPGTRKIKSTFGAEFSAANGFAGVMQANWISKGEKYTGSMIVFLASKDDATRALSERMVKVDGSISLVSEYQKIIRPQRCFNCHDYGHQAARCTKETKCGKCAGPYAADKCEATNPTCAACKGPHTAKDNGCPTYRRELNKLRSRREPNSVLGADEGGE